MLSMVLVVRSAVALASKGGVANWLLLISSCTPVAISDGLTSVGRIAPEAAAIVGLFDISPPPACGISLDSRVGLPAKAVAVCWKSNVLLGSNTEVTVSVRTFEVVLSELFTVGVAWPAE